MEAHLGRERRGRAQYVLGRMYQSGDSVPRNYLEAVKCFREAAELGDVNGQYNLGRIYQCGTEIKRNCREAEKWFRKAASQGHGKAQYILGVLYTKGLDVKRDIKEAEKWKFKALEDWGSGGTFDKLLPVILPSL